MTCPLRLQLEKHYREAAAASESLRDRLRETIGVSTKEEYERIRRQVELARKALQQARHRLEEHVQEHGCGAASGVAAG